MDMGFELTVYAIAIMITGGLVFLTRSVITIDKALKKQMSELQLQLSRIVMSQTGVQQDKSSGNSELTGEIDLTHPRTGEKLRAKARFRVISSRPGSRRP